MKKKPVKKSKPKRTKRVALHPMVQPMEPKPFSAHFHAEGRTMDELHDNLRGMFEKHIKRDKKAPSKGKGRTLSVEDALSS